jgi:hypothetical protein
MMKSHRCRLVHAAVRYCGPAARGLLIRRWSGRAAFFGSFIPGPINGDGRADFLQVR